MSEPVSDHQTGTRPTAVGVIFWQPDVNAYPQIMASWDGDKLDRELAETLYNAIDQNPGFDDARRFIDDHLPPSHWHTDENVAHWLEALEMEVPGPAFHHDTVYIDADPVQATDVTVAVIRWADDVWDDVQVLAGTDPNLLERRLAETIHERLTTAVNTPDGGDDFLDMFGEPDYSDPQSVFTWLDRVGRELEFPVFTTHHTMLAPNPQVAPTYPQSVPAVDMTMVADVPAREVTVAVGAIFEEGSHEWPSLYVGRDRERVERDVAAWLHDLLRMDSGDDALAFLDRHKHPADWATASDVSRWLDGYQVDKPGPAFIIDAVPVQVADPDSSYTLNIATVTTNSSPWDTRILADTDLDTLHRRITELTRSSGSIGDPVIQSAYLAASEPQPPTNGQPPAAPTGEGPDEVTVGVIWWTNRDNDEPEVIVGIDRAAVERSVAVRLWERTRADQEFYRLDGLLDRLGDPTDLDSEEVAGWIDGYQEGTSMPETRITEINAEVFASLTGQAANRAVVDLVGPPRWEETNRGFELQPIAEPASPVVDSSRLSAGVIVWDDENTSTPVEMEVIIDTNHDALVRKMAVRLCEEASYSPPSEDVTQYLEHTADPVDLDMDELEVWLEGLRQVMPHPQFTCYPILATATGQRLPTTTPEPVPTATSPVAEADRERDMMAEYGREAYRIWGDILDSGIPEMLAQSFPAMPSPEDWPDMDGTLQGSFWEAAVEDWMEACVGQAAAAAGAPGLLDRLAVLERFRDKTAMLLADSPLPEEPQRDDYLVTGHPAYDGEIDSGRYGWDRTQWQSEFPKAARHRDAVLSSLLSDSYQAAPTQSDAGRNRGLEKARVEALKELIVPDGTGRALGEAWLAGGPRRHIGRLLDEIGNRPVVVPGPDGHQNSGHARNAHWMLAPGVYEATSLDGDDRYRLVVGRSPRTGGPGWAVAVDPDHWADQNALDRLVKLRALAIRNQQTGAKPTDTTAHRTARSGVDPRVTRQPEPSWFGQTTPSQATPGISI